jgi:hypothetical protein
MALNVSLNVSLYNMQEWEPICEQPMGVNITEAYITNDQTPPEFSMGV